MKRSVWLNNEKVKMIKRIKINRSLFYCGVVIISFVLGFCFSESKVDKKYSNYIHPYSDYSTAYSFGDTVKYNKIVEERRSKTPSHPDYFDLSVMMAAEYGYLPAYYNTYLALHDLYKYNHFEMSDNVKCLMYSYLQLAIESNDSRITNDDLKCYHAEFPDGIIVE